MDKKEELIVLDDDENTTRLVEYVLEGSYEVHRFHQGKDVIDYLAKRNSSAPRVIGLFDNFMPDLEGHEVISQVRELGYHHGVEFHAWSTNHHIPEVQEIYKKLNVPFHAKPEHGNMRQQVEGVAAKFGYKKLK